MNEIEEIKAKIGIEDLVGEYVVLKKAGKTFKGLCPWHQEKSPSFTVSPENQMCWCFGCQKGGDIFNFLQYTEGLDFRESLEVLADKAGVKINKGNFQKSEDKNSILEILEVINIFYQNELKNNNLAKKYLENRNISNDLISKFNIGFSPENGNILFSFLIKKGFSKEEIFKTGVFSSSNFDGNNIYDRFNLRIIFPIKNIFGKTIGFGGRIFGENSGKNQAKYLNSPEGPVFDKSNNLYALNIAKEEIKNKKFVLLTEGYMDTIACHKAGIFNTVASLGTAFNEKHFKVLKRYTENFYICFDQDNAGISALKRVVELLSDFDVNIKVVKIPYGKDPDECIEKDKNLFLNSVENPVGIVDYFFEKLKEKYDLNKTEEKKSLQKEIFEIISFSKNNIDKIDYLKKFSNLVGISEKLILEDFDNFTRKTTKYPIKNKSNLSLKQEKITTLEYLFGLFLANEDLGELIQKNFLIEYMDNNYLKSVYKQVFDKYNSEDILKNLENEEKTKLLKFKLFGESSIIHDSETKIKEEFLKTIKKANLELLELKEKKLKLELSKNKNSIIELVKITKLIGEIKK